MAFFTQINQNTVKKSVLNQINIIDGKTKMTNIVYSTEKAQKIALDYNLPLFNIDKEPVDRAKETYSKIKKNKIELSLDEEVEIFNALWNNSKTEESKNEKINLNLPKETIEKIVKIRGKMPGFENFVTKTPYQDDIVAMLDYCKLTEEETTKFWEIYQVVREDKSKDTKDLLCTNPGNREYHFVNDEMALSRTLMHMVSPEKITRVMEIGTGKDARVISRLVYGFSGMVEGYGFDYSIKKEHDLKMLHLHQIKDNKLPLEENMIDLAFAYEVMIYQRGKKGVNFVNEILRTMKEGGLFLFTYDPNKWTTKFSLGKKWVPNLEYPVHLDLSSKIVAMTKLKQGEKSKIAWF